MMVLVTYDVDFTEPKGASRLRKVARICEKYGVRVQNSVFEMLIDNAQLVLVQNDISKVFDAERDSVRFYMLGKKWETKIVTMGAKKSFTQDAPLIL